MSSLFAVSLALLGAANPLAHGQTGGDSIPPRIVTSLHEAERTTLPGNTSPLAQKQFDQGAVSDSTPANRILLVLKRSASQEADLKQLVADQQNASSANFHKWLTPDEFGSRFGPAGSDIAQVTAWLQAKGFTINKVSHARQVIDFSGTAGQVKDAFKTELHTYSRQGVVFHANNSDPQIPTAFAPVIAGFASLNDIKPRSNAKVKGTALMNPKSHAAVPQWNYAEECASYANGVFSTFECTYYPPTPGDLAVEYNANPVYKAGTTGQGVSIGVISASNIDLGVVKNYRTLFGFANTANLPLVTIDGNDPGQNSAALEAYLDVEAASAMAPDATVNLYASADTLTTSGLVNAIVRAVDDNASDILNLSYGQCENALGASGNQFFYQAWEQAAAQGQSVFVSAGDGGSAGCDDFDQVSQASLGLAVSGFASTPFNTAVGGTDFYYSQWQEGIVGDDLQAQIVAAWGTSLPTTNPSTTLIAPIQEQPWNDGYGEDINTQAFGYTIAAGSGGASSCATGTGQDPTTGAYLTCTAGYPKPSWQVGKGVPADGVRDLPDVSLFAADGSNYSFWPICAGLYDCRGDATVAQYSVPVTAVGGTSASSPAMAGIMALVDQTQKGRQGNANYTLYALATQFPNSFNDVTTGSNDVGCAQGTPNCSLDTNGDGLYTLQHYSAGLGYDQASGLGSINIANLVANWSKITYKSTATTLSVASSSVVHGTPISFTAGVTAPGGTPTGSVALVSTSATPGETGLGTVALTNGTGTGSFNSLPGGTYSIVGTYGGDGSFSASTSSPASITVTSEASTSGMVATDYNPNIYPPTLTTLKSGASISYDDQMFVDVTVASKSGNGNATGPVTFFDGTTKIGTANVSASGVAELATVALTPGAHTLSASYAGDASLNPSTTTSLPINVTQGASNVYLDYLTSYDSSYNPFVYAGQPFIVTVNVPGGAYGVAPTGTVILNFAGLPAQTVTLTPVFGGVYNGTGYATFTPTVTGSYILSASYSGDANYAPSTAQSYSAIGVETATLAPTSTTLTNSTTGVVGPDGVFKLSAQVTGSVPGKIPTGNVLFSFGPLAYQTPLDAQGRASILFGGEAVGTGTNEFIAQYQGDKVYAQSTSLPVVITANLGDYSLTASDQVIAMKSGSTGSTTLTIAEMEQAVSSGLTGAVNLTCTTASAAITCSIASPALNLLPNGAQSSTILTINSHVTVARNDPAEPFLGGKEMLGGGMALATLLVLIPRRRRKFISLLALTLIATFGFGLAGCSGHGGSSQPPPIVPSGNAAPGTYQVTVAGNLGGVQHSLNLKVIVQ